MDLILSSELDRVAGKSKEAIITTGRRVYINRDYIKEVIPTKTDIEFRYNDGTVKYVAYTKLGTKPGEVVYNYYPDKNIYMSDYIRFTDKFMLFLIDSGCNTDFETAVKEFGRDMTTGIKSLLKPVYVRYNFAKRKQSNLLKIRENIQNINMVQTLVLYDVPIIIEDSKLKILGDIKIDIREQEVFDRVLYKYDCVLFGGIKKFDRVEIDLKDEVIDKIIFTGKGYY